MTTTTTIYDDSQNDDCAHEDVRRARAAGRARGEREAEAATSVERTCWYPIDIDALPLVEFGAEDTIGDDRDEREAELATICNRAAAERWEELVEEYSA